jgi:hypothetical protein
MLHDRVRTPTEYPGPPDALINALRQLVAPLPTFDRVSAGFPGVVRKGLVLSAPHFVTVDGPGSRVDPELVHAWDHFDLAGALEQALQRGAVTNLIGPGETADRERPANADPRLRERRDPRSRTSPGPDAQESRLPRRWQNERRPGNRGGFSTVRVLRTSDGLVRPGSTIGNRRHPLHRP